ncbi:hypothetical protein [Paenibacillus sp. FSL L8-0463]|uniref:hypothetical protein n=1 Tax=Paenibacillus sp. FSL L8-0463 TaxID=2954687 RepID=UPI003119D242
MGENHYGEISIPKILIDEEIMAQITKDFCLNEIDVFLTSDVDSYESNGVISYSDAMASGGCFDELESLLKQRRIPFDRYSSESYDYPPERVYFRPDREEGKEEICIPLDYDGETFIQVCYLQPLLTLSPLQMQVELQNLINKHDPQVTPLAEYVMQNPSLMSNEQGDDQDGLY